MNEKTILISGSASGIGAAIAKMAFQKGYKVIVHDKTDSDGLKQINTELNGSIKVVFDITKKNEVDEGINSLKQSVPNIDVLVNCAGANLAIMPFEELTEDAILNDYRVNVLGHVFVTQAVLPMMKEKSSIINITSLRAIPELASSGSLAYSMHKGAMTLFTTGLSKILAERQIRVNAVAPGHCKTPFASKYWRPGQEEESIKCSFAQRVAIPEDIAQAVLFLAEAEHIFGQTILVDGGYSLKGK